MADEITFEEVGAEEAAKSDNGKFKKLEKGEEFLGKVMGRKLGNFNKTDYTFATKENGVAVEKVISANSDLNKRLSVVKDGEVVKIIRQMEDKPIPNQPDPMAQYLVYRAIRKAAPPPAPVAPVAAPANAADLF